MGYKSPSQFYPYFWGLPSSEVVLFFFFTVLYLSQYCLSDRFMGVSSFIELLLSRAGHLLSTRLYCMYFICSFKTTRDDFFQDQPRSMAKLIVEDEINQRIDRAVGESQEK